ncbi:hypothetical protein, partial [Pseudomonas syringae group genomosp. 7]|uniref:hypothetical protein n=1 Tax=Pseudomonas syringae group genomosp. 7 TaxID=251699 RepID=UPI001C7F0027
THQGDFFQRLQCNYFYKILNKTIRKLRNVVLDKFESMPTYGTTFHQLHIYRRLFREAGKHEHTKATRKAVKTQQLSTIEQFRATLTN